MGFFQKIKDTKQTGDGSHLRKIEEEIAGIFRPGKNVDLVFYMNSRSPDVRSAIIHDFDHESKTIVISQTNPVTLSSTRFEKMGITTLLAKRSGGKKRVGVTCKILKFIRDYALNKRTKENAIAIRYSGPVGTYNIRGAFRYAPPINYEVKGAIIHKGKIFLSSRDFRIHNISVGGAGILVKTSNEVKRHPLMQIPVRAPINTEFDLIDFDSMKYDKRVVAVTDVVWKNLFYTDAYGYIGTRFVKMKQHEMNDLYKFIHEGQLISIRKAQENI